MSTPSSPTERERSGFELIDRVLERRGDRAYGGWTAAVRRGITSSTELSAYGATERFVPRKLGEHQARALRRAAAICAKAKQARPDTAEHSSLGRSLAGLEEKHDAPSIASRVNTLPLLDMENAALSLDHLVSLCAQHGVPVDFQDLARTLVRWGDGTTVQSQENRRRLVRDFYTTPDPTTETSAQEGTL